MHHKRHTSSHLCGCLLTCAAIARLASWPSQMGSVNGWESCAFPIREVLTTRSPTLDTFLLHAARTPSFLLSSLQRMIPEEACNVASRQTPARCRRCRGWVGRIHKWRNHNSQLRCVALASTSVSEMECSVFCGFSFSWASDLPGLRPHLLLSLQLIQFS
jgi:hypothetical protein